ncbi:peptidase domain-containing ABC transporter [Cohnella fermenti]|uniref:Cyclic nucleotide-binding domain-containing protein n=1 Tax=Cohnella fermenti TaxID=2565925 RepID=A0A4S4BRA3_9BACL|nr:peptidase domain-containing ABC transporter [Cohnella fermenti]THF77521.1 cyclic nucleotide-binding domain-containing protein [Cohnella fermenti]
MRIVIDNGMQALEQLSAFGVFTLEEKRLLAGQLRAESYSIGQTIVGRDGRNDSFYVILAGKARKIGYDTEGKETNLGLLHPGEHFGEHFLLEGEEAPPLTIRASTDLELLRLDRLQFKEMIEQRPAIEDYFRKYLASDVMRAFLKSRTVLSAVDPAALRSLLERLELREYEPEACLVREGEPGDSFYILKAGTAIVEKRPGATVVNRLYPGDFFGELALLTGEPRKATIRASGKAAAFRLSKSDFEELIRDYPVILDSIRSIASHYTSQAMTLAAAPEADEPADETAAARQEELAPPPDKTRARVLAGLPRISWRRRRKYPVVMQQSEMDCGPSCLTMIARHYGLNASVNRMRERCNVGTEGASLLGLIDTLETLGFKARGLNLTASLLRNMQTPFIAHWDGHHYVVVYEVGERGLVVADPALGYLDTWSCADFGKHWSGLAIALEPDGPLPTLEDKELLWSRYLAYALPSRKLLLTVLGLSSAIEGTLLLLPIMSQLIFDRVLGARDWPLLHLLAVVMALLACAGAVSVAVRQTLIGKLASAIDRSMLDNFYRRLFRLPYSYFAKRTSGDILTRVYENEKLRRLMTDHAVELTLDSLTLLVYGGLMFYYDAGLALIAFASLPFYVGLYAYILPRMRRNLRKQMNAEGESQTRIVEAVHAIATVKGVSMERSVRRKLMDKLGELLALRLEGNRLEAVVRAFSSALRTLSQAALLIFGAAFVLNGQLSAGGLVAFTVLFASFLFAVEMISVRVGELSEARISMERLNDVYEATPEHAQPERMRMLPALRGHIRFDKVAFQYYRGGRMILQNLELELKPGQTVALVGRSGSGKSTIAHLLLKLLEPTSGAVYVDGYPLREAHAASIRRQVGVVQQETALFRGSVRENIDLHGEASFEEIERAALLAGADEFIQSLPLGYDTVIGEGGIRLSGGQRQRIVIARALVGNPRILVFDEATSALDAESERVIQQNMGEMLRGRTTLIIAHRLSTIRHADRIVVLDNGSVVESGTHDELLGANGLYSHLLRQQAG